MTHYLRSPETIVVGSASEVIVVYPGGGVVALKREAVIASRLLPLLTTPKTVEEIVGEAGTTAGQTEQTLRVLVSEGVVVAGSAEYLNALLPRRGPVESHPRCENMVFAVCGTIQAACVLPLLSAMKNRMAANIEVILTDAATKFVSPQTISYLGMRVWTDAFESREAVSVPHIRLAAEAELVAVIPASAHTIHKLANGECSDLVSLVVAATAAPVVVAPAMNEAMLRNKAIRRNVEQLKADGIYIIEPGLAFEISEPTNKLKFCGIGVRDTSIVGVLGAVLDAHRRLHEERIHDSKHHYGLVEQS